MGPGTTVGDRFAIEFEAGSGGMGTVYAARDSLNGERVALKVLQRTGTLDAQRFALEARALVEIDHPCVVRYVAHGLTSGGQPYLAMEWLEGEDLAIRLEREGLTVAESVRLALHVADALAALHKRGIVHRDVKPSNVFLCAGGVDRVKLLDFGIARVQVTATRLTRAGALLGTPGYMAPEQARGDASLDARADVFSLGCVLFECLAGQPAFQGEHVMSLLAKILLAEAPRTRDVRPDVPLALDEACARMMRKSPAERPANGEAVRELLSSLSTSDGAAPVPKPPRSGASLALTDSEQRLVCLVLAGPEEREEADGPAGTAATIASDVLTSDLAQLRRKVEATGARLERLADGSLVAIAHREGPASDQAVQAARAALVLHGELPRAPIAVATGRGDVSAPLPVGQVIDRAARLFRLAARPGVRASIVLCDLTAGLLAERFEIERTPSGHLLLAEHATRTSARTLLGKETPCVGRDRELAVLDGLFADSTSEPSALAILVTAPSGGGKSRLRHEFLKRARGVAPDVEVWIGRGDPMQAGSPFSVLAHALRNACGIVEGEPLEPRRQKVRARVARTLQDHAASRVTPFLGELMGVLFDDAGNVQLAAARGDAQLMHDQLRSAWRELMDAETRAHPVILVLEDMHWGDQPTAAFVDDALRWFAERPLLVLALGRPEMESAFPKLWADRGAQTLPLRDLSKKAGEQLCRHVLGEHATDEIVSKLVQRAAGNAFFLEELLRATVEHGDAELPETVLAVVESRLDSLDPEARRVLRASSVFGQTFHAGGVLALLGDGASRAEVNEWLAILVRREVIAERDATSIPGESELAFRQGLVREAAYAMLTANDRRLGHALAGAWLETKGVTDAAVLAEHFERGGESARAAAAFLRAAHQAMAANDLARVLTLCERGLACTTENEGRAQLLVLEAETRKWRGENEAYRRAAEEAVSLAERGTNLWWAAMESLVVSRSLLAVSESTQAAVDTIEGAVADPTMAVPPRLVTAVCAAAKAMIDVGRYDRADRLLASIEARAHEPAVRDPMAAARFAEARSRRALVDGDISALRDLLLTALRNYEEVDDRRGACHVTLGAAYGSMLLGRYDDAERTLRLSFVRADALGVRPMAMVAKHNHGLALLRLGRLDEALDVESEALALAHEQRGPRIVGACLYYLSLIHHARGEFDDAERDAAESARICESVPPSRAEALAALAYARLAKGDGPGALAAAEESMQILREVGGIDEGEPIIRLVYAETLRAFGDRDASVRAITEAREHLDQRADKVSDSDARRTFLAAWENARTIALEREWSASG